jgi:hypothetical protein
MTVDKPADAAEVLAAKMSLSVQANGKLLMFNVAQDQIGQISRLLAGKKVAIFSMNQGDKSLEETFLELTAQAGTEIN